jgi:DNA helicase HerA-like ATPase
MSLESLLAQALNRKRNAAAEARGGGVYLGTAQALITGETAPFSLPMKPIQHAFVSGRTGSGKTTLLLRVMAEYHRAGIPFLFIDLHGQATDELLAMLR